MAGRRSARRCAAVAVLAALAAGPAAADEDCDPEVERALVESAETGARDDVRIVRHREMGIRDPESLFDLSCVTRMFDYRHSNILFRPDRAMSEMLGLLNRLICDRAREAFRGFNGRALDATVFARDLPRLPGLDVGVEDGNILDDARRGGERSRWRNPDGPGNVEAAPRPASRPPSPSRPSAAPAAPRSRPEVLRSILGGEPNGREGR